MPDPFESKTVIPLQLMGRHSTYIRSQKKPLVVPSFQRPFSWKKDQILTFWQDIVYFLKRKNKAPDAAYFLGPIVLMEEDKHLLVLDGQQRLATITILLSVIRDVAQELSKDPRLESDPTLKNDFMFQARDIHRDYLLLSEDTEEYSLTLNDEDRTFFRRCIQKNDSTRSCSKPLHSSHRRISAARRFIENGVKDWINKAHSLQEKLNLIKQLTSATVHSLNMVAISVESEEDAFIIFETLNDRGLRLAISDLLLNLLMQKAGSPQERDDIRAAWGEMLNTLSGVNINYFLRHFWISYQGDIKKESLFKIIKDSLAKRSPFASPALLAQKMQLASFAYKSLLKPERGVFVKNQPAVSALTEVFKERRALPLLLSAYDILKPNSKDFGRIVRASLSLTIRYSVLGQRNPARLEDAFYRSAVLIREKGAAAVNQVISILRDINPSDSALKAVLEDIIVDDKNQAFYLVKEAAKLFQKSQSINFDSNNITLEHVFPKGAKSSAWPNKDSMQGLLWHIGNLVPLEEKINITAANKSFAEKRSLYMNSNIDVVKHIANNFTSWTQADILEHGRTVLNKLLTLWPENLA